MDVKFRVVKGNTVENQPFSPHRARVTVTPASVHLPFTQFPYVHRALTALRTD